jgi:hypothetical protein
MRGGAISSVLFGSVALVLGPEEVSADAAYTKWDGGRIKATLHPDNAADGCLYAPNEQGEYVIRSNEQNADD